MTLNKARQRVIALKGARRWGWVARHWWLHPRELVGAPAVVLMAFKDYVHISEIDGTTGNGFATIGLRQESKRVALAVPAIEAFGQEVFGEEQLQQHNRMLAAWGLPLLDLAHLEPSRPPWIAV